MSHLCNKEIQMYFGQWDFSALCSTQGHLSKNVQVVLAKTIVLEGDLQNRGNRLGMDKRL